MFPVPLAVAVVVAVAVAVIVRSPWKWMTLYRIVYWRSFDGKADVLKIVLMVLDFRFIILLYEVRKRVEKSAAEHHEPQSRDCAIARLCADSRDFGIRVCG